jgi:hypothetical protein
MVASWAGVNASRRCCARMTVGPATVPFRKDWSAARTASEVSLGASGSEWLGCRIGTASLGWIWVTRWCGSRGGSARGSANSVAQALPSRPSRARASAHLTLAALELSTLACFVEGRSAHRLFRSHLTPTVQACPRCKLLPRECGRDLFLEADTRRTEATSLAPPQQPRSWCALPGLSSEPTLVPKQACSVWERTWG